MLTLWVRERWALSGLQAAVFVCCTGRLGWLALKKQPVVPGFSAILLAICLWGALQLVEHWTFAPYDTANATLYWLSAACLVWLGQQACAAREERRLFLKGALVLGALIAFAGIVQLFTSPGRVFWLFPLGIQRLGHWTLYQLQPLRLLCGTAIAHCAGFGIRGPTVPRRSGRLVGSRSCAHIPDRYCPRDLRNGSWSSFCAVARGWPTAAGLSCLFWRRRSVPFWVISTFELFSNDPHPY